MSMQRNVAQRPTRSRDLRRVMFAAKPETVEVPLNDIGINNDIRQAINDYFDSVFDMLDRARTRDESVEDRLHEINTSSEAYNVVLRDGTVRQYDHRIESRPRKPGVMAQDELFRFVLIAQLSELEDWTVASPVVKVYCKCFDIVPGRVSMRDTALDVDSYLTDDVDVMQTAVTISPLSYSMLKSYTRENMAKFVEIQTKARIEGLGGHHV